MGNKKKKKYYCIEPNCKNEVSRKNVKRCLFCERKREHPVDCECMICKAKRGETNGENNPHFKHGKTHNNKCIICGEIISLKATKCHSCANTAEGNGKYIDGRTNREYFCIDCGKKISTGSKRCNKCNNKYLWIVYKDIFLTALRNTRKKLLLKPTRPEILLNSELNKTLPNEYKYVGSSDFWIEGLNPDFINCNGQKKIIELFGDYWHNREDSKIRDKKRLKIYKKYGYETLVVWEKELKDMNKLKTKLINFNKK